MATPLCPLDGITVLDLSQNLPGPWLTQILQSLGAWVIKVEPPHGEGLRHMPPLRDGVNIAFAAINAGKSSVTLNLKDPEGQDLIHSMLARADVVVESFRPGVMARLGLEPTTLLARYPHLILCSVSGYGQDGPMASRAGHDLNFLARSGLLSLSTRPQSTPRAPAAQLADVGGGSLPGVIGVLAALIERQQTGRGRHLDIALARGVLHFAAMALPLANAGHVEPPGRGMLTGAIPCYRCYRTADGGALSVGALEPKFWTAFCRAAERPDLIPAGFDRRPEAHRQVEELIASRTQAAWVSLLTDVDCCIEPVLTPEEAIADPVVSPRLHHAGDVATVLPEVGGPVMPPPGPASPLGADLDTVLRRLGILTTTDRQPGQTS